MNIKEVSVTYVKNEIFRVVQEGETMIITKHGAPASIIISADNLKAILSHVDELKKGAKSEECKSLRLLRAALQ